MDAAVAAQKNVIESLHPSQRISAENLVRYLIMRSEDIRSLQDQLHLAGLSSLASSESHILFQLQAIQERLGREYPQEERSNCDYHYAQEIIRQRSTQLFGSKSDTSIPFVMVTFDTEFASNSLLVKKLLLEGMNIARINCAHDSPEVWENMIELVRMASDKTGLPCKIYMDLAGPKMRTSVPAAGRKEGRIRLETGQEVLLADPDVRFDPSEPVIGCSEPGIIRQLNAGERVLFDDGLIESCVVSRKDSVAVVKIIRNSSKKLMLKAGKGMNFPDSRLNIPELTEYDRSILPFACRHADLIGYSFVRSTIGILELQDLPSAFPQRPHIVLKIETPEAVRYFPALLWRAWPKKLSAS
jgi:pyruvate kinase